MDMETVKEEPVFKDFSLMDESRKLLENHFYDSAFINEYGRIETARSERYGLSYSVIIIHIESFGGAKTAPGKKELLKFLKAVVSALMKVVRTCDVAGMLEDKRIIVILPHTDYFGSLITIKKIQKALESVSTAGEPRAEIIFAQATYPKDANGFGELVGTAGRRVAGRLKSLWVQLGLEGKLFWETVASLTSGTYGAEAYSTFDTGPDLDLKNSFIQSVNSAILMEIARTPEKRGILYLGVKKVSNDLPFMKDIETAGRTAMKIFVVGTDGSSVPDTKNSTTVALGDHRLEGVYFTFFMNEDAAYAVICRENWGDTHNCFHTSDEFIVEGLITKFQRDYSLQEQL
ncbi:MAG: diguanylate cyclase [Deltaproteobacteria bacterium]|nr:diguanylate cyclase [Deltaproteobacteria bacterium]